MAAKPIRNEVWLVDLGMVAKVRPCLVLSIPADEGTDRVLTAVVPHTTSTRQSRFEHHRLMHTTYMARPKHLVWHVPEPLSLTKSVITSR